MIRQDDRTKATRRTRANEVNKANEANQANDDNEANEANEPTSPTRREDVEGTTIEDVLNHFWLRGIEKGKPFQSTSREPSRRCMNYRGVWLSECKTFWQRWDKDRIDTTI